MSPWSRRTRSQDPPTETWPAGSERGGFESETGRALVANPTTTSTRLATINIVSQSEWTLCDDARRSWERAGIVGIMH